MNKRLPMHGTPSGTETPAGMHSQAVCRQTALPQALPAPSQPLPPSPLLKKNSHRQAGKRDQPFTRDALFVIRRNMEYHVVAENYSYKTEPYYTILSLEYEGKQVKPSSSSVLDAYVIPVCLERARAAGVPVCEWGISQAYVPLPALLYGLNYYSNNAEFAIVHDNEGAKDLIRHITNNGKYPFCFQKFPEGSEVFECSAIFGKTTAACSAVASYASILYDLFGLPLVRMVFMERAGSYTLSSLSPVLYSQLTDSERPVLSAYLSAQGFL